jgi:hypothetical protein
MKTDETSTPRREAGLVAGTSQDSPPVSLPADALDDQIAIVGTASASRRGSRLGARDRILRTDPGFRSIHPSIVSLVGRPRAFRARPSSAPIQSSTVRNLTRALDRLGRGGNFSQRGFQQLLRRCRGPADYRHRLVGSKTPQHRPLGDAHEMFRCHLQHQDGVTSGCGIPVEIARTAVIGKTPVRERRVVSAPIAGTLLRIRPKAGEAAQRIALLVRACRDEGEREQRLLAQVLTAMPRRGCSGCTFRGRWMASKSTRSRR